MLSHPTPVGCYTWKAQSSVCVVNRPIEPVQLVAACVIQMEDRKTEPENLPPISTISNSLYVPEAWGLNGGGEKRLNEQSEEYLQLPPLT